MPPVMPSRTLFPERSVISIRHGALNRKTRILSEFHGDQRLAPAGATARALAGPGTGIARRCRVARNSPSHRREGEERGGPGATAPRAFRLDLRAARSGTRGIRADAGPGERQARAAEGRA